MEKSWSLGRYKTPQRACRRQGLKVPNRMTQDTLNIERKVCKKKLKELQQKAPYLWVCHLQQRHRAALVKIDVDKAKALPERIKRSRKANVGGECKL